MTDCKNMCCHNEALGNRIMCGVCKRNDISKCICCDKDIGYRAFRCNECKLMNKQDYMIIKYYVPRRIYKNCIHCGIILTFETKRFKYCSDKCAEESRLNQIQKRREFQSCVICGKNMLGLGRRKCCSDNCARLRRNARIKELRNERIRKEISKR